MDKEEKGTSSRGNGKRKGPKVGREAAERDG